MTFLLDNLLFLTFGWIGLIGRKEEMGKSESISISSTELCVLIPAKREKYHTVRKTVQNIREQTLSPKIYILVDPSDHLTTRDAERVAKEFKNVVVLRIKARNKADVLNKAVQFLNFDYVIIIDVGDIFKEKDALENLLKLAKKGFDAVIPTFEAQQRDEWWQKIVDLEFKLWTKEVIRRIKKKFGFCPLPGTGLLLKTSKLRKVGGFPETLAEDGTLGLFIRKVAFCDSATLLYNLPSHLTDHLKQRSRWIAGFLQSLKFAKRKKKLVYLMPVVQWLTPISLALLPIALLHPLYPSLLSIIDWLAGGLLIYYLCKLFRLGGKKAILIPVWWFTILPTIFYSIKYLFKNEWFFSPKS